ncbi:hypothetical protein [Spirosoma sordidisoli]|uniref:Uncharacterized protein n=1 Tax=Spirosoma sordidisoli TaxID=2502893 RepID=A0A4V1RWT1_9BACT|nr:hypothetical protein [Spirosoma sordidisoli]RYC71348.1 hypothetical protein EQG79_04175 [Spirosoma sordidisoli]
MSVSSNSRKESTESNAAKQMRSTMGIHPELAQLNDKNLDSELPSRVAEISDTDVPGDMTQAAALASDEENDDMSAERIDESKRASWGQEPLPMNAEDASTDEDNPMTAYQNPDALSTDEKVADADWNRSTQEGAIPATRANEPDRTLGNS